MDSLTIHQQSRTLAKSKKLFSQCPIFVVRHLQMTSHSNFKMHSPTHIVNCAMTSLLLNPLPPYRQCTPIISTSSSDYSCHKLIESTGIIINNIPKFLIPSTPQHIKIGTPHNIQDFTLCAQLTRSKRTSIQPTRATTAITR